MISLLNFFKSYVFGPKLWIKTDSPPCHNHIAAGDPARYGQPSENDSILPKILPMETKEVVVDDYTRFTVEGSSMAAEGISDGDILLCEPINPESLGFLYANIYAVIEVDKEYYDKKNKTVNFDFKLRRTLYNVGVNPDFHNLLYSLKEKEDSLLYEQNEKALKRKFDEIYKYYDKSVPMMLSVTYRNGTIRYSFHPTHLIKYIGKYVVSSKNGAFSIREL